jgi:DNA-binding transcriptional regulator YiaG
MSDIIRSAHEALAIAKKMNGGSDSRWAPPTGEAIKSLRQRLKLSQSKFANMYGLDLKSLQTWEQETRSPEQATCLLLEMINQDSEGIAKLVKSVSEKQNEIA